MLWVMGGVHSHSSGLHIALPLAVQVVYSSCWHPSFVRHMLHDVASFLLREQENVHMTDTSDVI